MISTDQGNVETKATVFISGWIYFRLAIVNEAEAITNARGLLLGCWGLE
jgi:hypothetical protein